MKKQIVLVFIFSFLFYATAYAQNTATGGGSGLEPCSCDPTLGCACYTDNQVIENIAGPSCIDACKNCADAHGGEPCELCHSGLYQGQKIDCRTGKEYGVAH